MLGRIRRKKGHLIASDGWEYAALWIACCVPAPSYAAMPASRLTHPQGQLCYVQQIRGNAHAPLADQFD